MKQFWKDRKVLVTGAGGFIGSHLCERLLDLGANVTALVHYDIRVDRSNLEFLPAEKLKQIHVISGDICDPFFMRETIRGVDTVFHLAALIAIPYSYIAPQSYVRVNVEGTLNVAEACRREGTRCLVHTSTSETYGTAIYAPIDEKHPLQGQSPYSASKIGADKLVESYYLSFNLPAVTLRPFNTYGPRQSARAVIPTIISQIYSKSDAVVLGDLAPIRDMNYVKDTVEAYVKVAESENCLGQTLNAGSGRGISIGELAQLLMKVCEANKPIKEDSARIRPAKSEVFKLIASSERIKELTGWTPQWTLEAGLKETAEFVRANLNKFHPDQYKV